MKNNIHLKIVDFHAAHYLPALYGKCHKLHGHTYTFRNIDIVTEGVIDFSLIKKALERADHTILVPPKDFDFWVNVNKLPGCPCDVVPFEIEDDETTVEAIARMFEQMVLQIHGVKVVKFVLYETKGSGARRPVNESE